MTKFLVQFLGAMTALGVISSSMVQAYPLGPAGRNGLIPPPPQTVRQQSRQPYLPSYRRPVSTPVVNMYQPNRPIPQSQSVRAPQTYNFEGIVALNNCSGAVFQMENSRDSDKALVLTNGHCLEFGMPAPGQFIYGKPSSRAFRLLDANANSVARLTATEVVYSTMTKTDMTIYKLRETYGDIKNKYHIQPLMLASQHPSAAEPIEVISGYWTRGYTCGIEYFVNQLREDKWTSEDSIRYTRPGCETIGGTSGSPILSAGSRTIIGVNNTGNENGEKCTMDNPCEVDKNGKITYQKGVSYGQETYWIYSCLNQSNEIDLQTPGCLLPH
jgi:V8-like Glu-specific endopeptidase